MDTSGKTFQLPAKTRLAPSPTGALHLGNARTFLINWAIARSRGWKIVLRIEDLDGPRIKPGAIDLTVELLEWLGIDWDEGPLVQSADLTPYQEAMSRLARRGLAYPSDLTRTEIELAASAPQEGATESAFPALLRPPLAAREFDQPGSSWRFATPPEDVEFVDGFAGPQRHSPAATVGDFVVWTKRGQPSYQLAVVVDDARQGVTDIVRGDDLLDSAARQMLLYRALGLSEVPRYVHLPLVRGSDGKRLAKRHGDTRLDTYRAMGVRPGRVIGLIAGWSIPGLAGGAAGEMSAEEFRGAFCLDTMPRSEVTFSTEDNAWLCRRS
ncbi:MAG: glutamate--tRNA ligase family protein [Phycisphaerales bacterium]